MKGSDRQKMWKKNHLMVIVLENFLIIISPNLIRGKLEGMKGVESRGSTRA